MIKCSNCGTNIELKYCPNCGQKHTGKRVGLITLLADFGDSLFSLEKSFWLNIKLLLMNPGKVTLNYWNGFRNFFFNPSKLLLVAAIFLGAHLFIFDNTFLQLKISGKYLSAQLAILVVMIPFLTLSSFLTYAGFKKNFFEHLALNTYNLSFWIIVFSILSAAVSFLHLNFLINPLRFYLFILIFIWNSSVFDLSVLKRILYITLNAVIFVLIFGGSAYLLLQSRI